MTDLSVNGRPFEVEQHPHSKDQWIQLAIEYATTTGNEATARVDLPEADFRGDIDHERLQQRVTEWVEATDEAKRVRSVTVREVEPLQRVTPVAAEQPPANTATKDSSELSSVDFEEGETIVYHAGGADSPVYGYTTEAIVAKAPPIERPGRANTLDKVKIRTGSQEKLIPLEWVVGCKADVEIEVDRPTPELH